MGYHKFYYYIFEHIYYTYSTEGTVYGYNVGTIENPTTVSAWDLGRTAFHGIYNFWLAAPGADANYGEYLYCVGGGYPVGMQKDWSDSTYNGVRPVVCLKTGTRLTINDSLKGTCDFGLTTD